MDRQSGRISRVVVWAGLGTLALGLATGRVGASPIRAYRHELVVRNERSLGPVWARFLNAGPGRWATSHAPRFPSGLVLPLQNGQVVETRFVDYLLWRRTLDPARFDHYHPIVGPELARFIRPVTALSVPVLGLVRSEGATPAPGVVLPQIATPEPGTLTLALVLSVGGLWWRRRSCPDNAPGMMSDPAS